MMLQLLIIIVVTLCLLSLVYTSPKPWPVWVAWTWLLVVTLLCIAGLYITGMMIAA